MQKENEKPSTQEDEAALVRQIFDDFDTRQNIVGLYDLLYKIDRRVNPDLYARSDTNPHHHD